MTIYKSEKGQAMPGLVQPIVPKDFEPTDRTELRWQGGGGVMLNCRGTVLMIGPVLEGFDMPLLFQPPIAAPQVPRLDGVLITHIDNDHFRTCTDRICGRIVGHNFVGGKAEKRRQSRDWQAFTTQSVAKFAEKTGAISYWYKFSVWQPASILRKYANPIMLQAMWQRS